MIPRFNAGGIIRASDLNLLADEIRKNEITKVVGGTFSRTSGGTTISVTNEGGGGGGGGSFNYIEGDVIIDGTLNVKSNLDVDLLINQTQFAGPFQILPGWSESGYNVRVNGNSYLTNIETGENIPIEGLGAASGSLNDVPASEGQFALPEPGQYIWLSVEFFKNEIVSAFIEYGSPSYSWTNFPSPVEFEASSSNFREAKYARIAIAQVHLKSEGNVSGLEFNMAALLPNYDKTKPINPAMVKVVRQITTTHLGIQYAVIQSAVVPILVPYSASAQISPINL
jgi:hypothetical protein